MNNPELHPADDSVVIAIDGPAASGKSTVAKELARRLSFRFLNSGDLYRAMTWTCLDRGIDCYDSGKVAATTGVTQIDISCDGTNYFPQINGIDPRQYLRDERINAHVSPVSAVPAVRYILSAAIRTHSHGRQTVIEGRDIGSAVFPESPYKFYIDAHPEVRQRRRRNQGQMEEISRRDRIDSTRHTDPLTVAPGATVIDSSALDIDGVVGKILQRLSAQGLPQALKLCSKE